MKVKIITGLGLAKVEARQAMDVFSGVVAANMVVVIGTAEKPGGGVISLPLVMPEKKFHRRPTAKGVGLRVADSHTGNHPEDGFTPLETIRRLLVVIGRRSHSGFEGEAFEPKRRKKRGEGSSEAHEKDPGTPPPIPTTEDKEPRKKTTKEETMRRLLKIILPALRLKKVDTFLWLTHKSLTPIQMQEDNKL
ncbi:hypothetical protein Tco_0349804 [Tanacetum coccineum]